MSSNNLKIIKTIIYDSFRSVIIDNSLPIFILILFIINISIFHLYDYDLFEEGISKFTLFVCSAFTVFTFIVYSGYLGSKFLGKEISDNTIYPMLIASKSKFPIYIGKITSGILILFLISSIQYGYMVVTFLYWGPLSNLVLVWILKYFLLFFLCGVSIFLLSVIIGLISKGFVAPMMFTSIYVVISFFSYNLIPENLNTLTIDSEIKLVIVLLPSATIRYAQLFIKTYGFIPLTLILLPLILILWGLITSYYIFKVVKI
ncbi:MAG: hypothetical protein R6U61_00870 [Thermoplasmata archaeon]